MIHESGISKIPYITSFVITDIIWKPCLLDFSSFEMVLPNLATAILWILQKWRPFFPSLILVKNYYSLQTQLRMVCIIHFTKICYFLVWHRLVFVMATKIVLQSNFLLLVCHNTLVLYNKSKYVFSRFICKFKVHSTRLWYQASFGIYRRLGILHSIR